MATSTNYTNMAYVEETTEGEAPIGSAFQFQTLATTGSSLSRSITTAKSDVIRDDRQTDDLTPVDASVTGDINFELSHDPYSPWLKALLQNDTAAGTIAETAVSGSYVADVDELSKTSLEAAIAVGDVFSLTSATEPDADGSYTCIALGTNAITIYPALPVGTSAFTDAVLTTSAIHVNGNDDPKSYTIRKTAIESSTTYRWYYYGCKINSLNLKFATGSILNGSFGIVGRTETTGTAALTNEGTDLAVPAYTIMNSVTSVGAIHIGGVVLGDCKFSSLDLTYDNQTNESKSIGTLGACDTASFSVMISGNVEAYFKDQSMYDKFTAAESFSVTIIVTDGDDQTMGFNMPKCKFDALDTPIPGRDAFLKQTGSFTGLRDATGDYMFKMSFVDVA